MKILVSNKQVGNVLDEIKLKAYASEESFKRKMKIGFCKDEEQNVNQSVVISVHTGESH